MNFFRFQYVRIFAAAAILLSGTKLTYANGLGDAQWCAGPGATKMIKDQPMGPPSVCTKYLGFGLKTQNQLAQEARTAAKENRNNDAIHALQMCQCHNPGAQAAIEADKEEVLKWLRQ